MENQGSLNVILVIVPSWYNKMMNTCKHNPWLEEVITSKILSADS